MQIKRNKLLKRLDLASCGLSSKISTTGSKFIFGKGMITAFSEEIIARVKGFDDIDCCVSSSELLGLIKKFPDETIELKQSNAHNELRIRGKNRKAGIPIHDEESLVSLRKSLPKLKSVKWISLSEELFNRLKNAALVCGRDDSFDVTSCVHVTPDVIESCDNYKLYRCPCQTGFNSKVFIPGKSIYMLRNLTPTHFASADNWLHLKLKGGIISIRCREFGKYMPLKKLCDDSGEIIQIPSKLKSVIERAEITTSSIDYSTTVSITLSKNAIQVKSRSDKGWFNEKIKADYNGPKFGFNVRPDLITQMIGHSDSVKIKGDKMTVIADGAYFVIALQPRKS